MKTFILSHVDADGILSCRIAQLAFPDNVAVFQHWTKFGLDDEMTKNLVDGLVPGCPEILKDKLDRIVVLDLGSDVPSLENAATLADLTSLPVIWLDHHSVSADVLKLYQGRKDFTVVNQQDTCTSAMAYELFSSQTSNNTIQYWQGLWAILGIYGDVANKASRSKRLLETLKPNYSELFGNQIFWNPKQGPSEYEIPMMLCRYFNTPRRVAFHIGCQVALQACEEVERSGSVYRLFDEHFDEVTQARFPNLYILKQWENKYVDERSKVFQAESMQYFEFDYFTVSIFAHPWDLGGYVASIKSRDRWKSHFAINTGLPDIIKVTGRNPGMPEKDKKTTTGLPPVNLNLGATFVELKVGGGHHMAASAAYSKDHSVADIIKQLSDVVDARVKAGLESLKMEVG